MEGSRAEQRYELNGKECRQRRKDVSGSRGGMEEGAGVVGLYIGRIGRAQCSLEPYEPGRVGQRGSLRIKTPTHMKR